MLTTDRLILRTARQNDLLDLFAIYSDPHAMRYWSTPPHVNPEQTQENLDQMIVGEGQTFFIIEKDGTAIGTVGMHQNNEVGFLLHPNFWRQGIVTEAMKVILPHIWATTNQSELVADADPHNVASVGLLESLGFTQSHVAKNTFCINGVWSDSIYYKIYRPS